MSDATRASHGTESFASATNGADAECMADQAKRAAEQALNDLKNRAAEYLELGREKAVDVSEQVEEQIRHRPVQAVAIAAGVGFALGLLFTRRS